MTVLTQQELESRLREAANCLRGTVDAADFKAYVFPVLFFKWISDTWGLEHEQAVADFGEKISAEEEADYHRFVVPDGCHWADVRNTTKNIGVKLRRTLDRLEEANPDKLASSFGVVAWGNKDRLPEHALINLIDTFDRTVLNRDRVPGDMLGAAYEYLLREFADASGKKAGEFFTPRAVVPPPRRHPRPAARRVLLRPGLRLRRDARRNHQRRPGQGRRHPHAAPLRAGGEPHHGRDRPHEPCTCTISKTSGSQGATRSGTRSSSTAPTFNASGS